VADVRAMADTLASAAGGAGSVVLAPAHLAPDVAAAAAAACAARGAAPPLLHPLFSVWPHVSAEAWPPSLSAARLSAWRVDCGGRQLQGGGGHAGGQLQGGEGHAGGQGEGGEGHAGGQGEGEGRG
jgi:hypothetical protein